MPTPSPPRSLGSLPGMLVRAARSQTLLLVEDSRFAAEPVRVVCGRAGIRLRRAETLADARRHLRHYRPEIALIDLGLPDGSGLDLIAELTGADPRRPRIVATSADPDRADEARAVGADRFCAKPMTLPELLEAILGVTSGHARALIARSFDPADPAAAGIDPMALHDDLKRAHALLHEKREVRYASQFVGGIARSVADTQLMTAAARAGSGNARPLLEALDARVAAGPPI